MSLRLVPALVAALALAACGEAGTPPASDAGLLTDRLDRSAATVRTATDRWAAGQDGPPAYPRERSRLAGRLLEGRAYGLAPRRVAELRRWFGRTQIADSEAGRRSCAAGRRAVAAAGVRIPPGATAEARAFVARWNRYLERFGVVLRTCAEIEAGETDALLAMDGVFAGAETLLRTGRAREYRRSLRAYEDFFGSYPGRRGLRRALADMGAAETAMRAAALAAGVEVDLE